MGIWLLVYGIANENREACLDWFHQTHVAEKLARSGYDWAAHYQVVDDKPVQRYVAMFGSGSSRAFFDPSPAELKPKQDALTREMIALRVQPMSMVCSVEWSESHNGLSGAACVEDAIRLQVFASDSNDQQVGAWCAQEYFPAVQQLRGCVSVRKLLCSSGSPRHAVLEEYETVTACQTAVVELSERGQQVCGNQHLDTLVAERIF